MANMNRVELMGNLTRDPEIRTTPNGKSICKLGVAVNRKFKTASGELKEVVGFFDVEAWGNLGEQCEKYLRKGRPVFVEGRLQHDRWKTAQGESRSKIRITAERVHFLGSKDRNGTGAEGPGRATTSTPFGAEPATETEEEEDDEASTAVAAGDVSPPARSEADLPF